MRQAKNNSIMHKIKLSELKKASIRLQNNRFSLKNIRLKALIPADKEEVNFLYGHNLPKDRSEKQKISCKLRRQAMIPATWLD